MNKLNVPSVRADLITRRTYNRPLNTEGTKFESWEQTVSRVIGHQKWLWERAANKKINKDDTAYLETGGTKVIDVRT